MDEQQKVPAENIKDGGNIGAVIFCNLLFVKFLNKNASRLNLFELIFSDEL